jgi:hypothetical protein
MDGLVHPYRRMEPKVRRSMKKDKKLENLIVEKEIGNLWLNKSITKIMRKQLNWQVNT